MVRYDSSAEPRMTTPQNTDDTETHRLTAEETLWVRTEFIPDSETEDRMELVDETITRAFEPAEHLWTYECTCGETFETFATAAEHIESYAGSTSE